MMKPTIYIEYCPKCGWMLRASWIAQEILTTFPNELFGAMLQPSEVNGRFTIMVNETKIFDRKEAAGFPEIKTIKQLIRDIVSPMKSLGHSDKKSN